MSEIEKSKDDNTEYKKDKPTIKERFNSFKEKVSDYVYEHPRLIIGGTIVVGILRMISKTVIESAADRVDDRSGEGDLSSNIEMNDQDNAPHDRDRSNSDGATDFERIADEEIKAWYPRIQRYRIHDRTIVLDVKYNKRDSTYNAYVGFDENWKFVIYSNPYNAAGPGSIGYAIERRMKELSNK